MDLVLRATRLQQAGFRHGFSLRTGGVSRPPYDTLNLARNLADDPVLVAENHARLANEVSQVHGCVVHEADARVTAPEFRTREGDAVWTQARDLAVGVRVADCVPVLLASPDTGAVAAVHAGWRGVVSNVVGASVAALCQAACVDPGRLLAAIGPHIGRDAFEVSAEVAAELAACAPRVTDAIIPRAPRPHVDLARIVTAQLVAAGLSAAAIERVAGCTYQDALRFFSFRRDGQASGRHLAVIVAGC